MPVIVTENPHSDPVTIAWSKVDVYLSHLADATRDRTRVDLRLKRAHAEVKHAETAIVNADAEVKARQQAVADAQAELAAAVEADPDIAAEVEARRAAAKTAEVAELTARLKALKGN